MCIETDHDELPAQRGVRGNDAKKTTRGLNEGWLPKSPDSRRTANQPRRTALREPSSLAAGFVRGRRAPTATAEGIMPETSQNQLRFRVGGGLGVQ